MAFRSDQCAIFGKYIIQRLHTDADLVNLEAGHLILVVNGNCDQGVQHFSLCIQRLCGHRLYFLIFRYNVASEMASIFLASLRLFLLRVRAFFMASFSIASRVMRFKVCSLGGGLF